MKARYKSAEYLLFIYFKNGGNKERTIIEKETMKEIDEFLETELPTIKNIRKWVVKPVYTDAIIKSKVLWEPKKEKK